MKFDKELEQRYQASRVPIDITNARFGFPVLITIETLLIVVDFYRLDELLMVASRAVTILFSGAILGLTYYQKFWSNKLIPLVYCVLAVTFFLTAFYAQSASYFLTNSLITYFFIVCTFASKRFLYSLLTNLFATIAALAWTKKRWRAFLATALNLPWAQKMKRARALGSYW